MPSDCGLSTLVADSMDRRPESDTAIHVDTEDHLTTLAKLPQQTHAPELPPRLCHPFEIC